MDPLFKGAIGGAALIMIWERYHKIITAVLAVMVGVTGILYVMDSNPVTRFVMVKTGIAEDRTEITGRAISVQWEGEQKVVVVELTNHAAGSVRSFTMICNTPTGTLGFTDMSGIGSGQSDTRYYKAPNDVTSASDCWMASKMRGKPSAYRAREGEWYSSQWGDRIPEDKIMPDYD